MKHLPPVDFSPCRQTVTLYHRLPGPDFCCVRRVFRGAFLDVSLNRSTGEEGTRYENCFLLVLPAGWQGRLPWVPTDRFDQSKGALPGFTLAPGDKLCEGEGPLLTTPEQWASFTPRQGAAVVKEVAQRRWMGVLSHIEAGGEQALGRSGLPHPRKGSFG